ncbi:hypothetical protein SKAU_G00241210 [Synaphobranchus kaupii]|uniref:Uncharacterized protein n=1 Tax=Synaphobranchus kaupii TaxID=118154 RepID=A0A9Q1ITD7_SYNKA|nr:hypothetical protein SKAU_G00241210 [Synaphobranchus kaupii]
MTAFAEATRILFRIIQTTHHLQNTAVSGGRTTSPASLQKKMQELATLVRPAGNVLNWLHTCMQILEEHYLENLGHLTGEHSSFKLAGGIPGRTTVTPPQDQYQREWPALRQTYPPRSPAPRRNAERTVLPQEALHHQRNRTSSGITGHHRDWEPVPLPQRPPRTTRDCYNSGSTLKIHLGTQTRTNPRRDCTDY